MTPDPPSQTRWSPFDEAARLAEALDLPGWRVESVDPEEDGTLSLGLVGDDGAATLRWRVDRGADGQGVAVEGLDGRFESEALAGLGADVLAGVAERVGAAIRREDPAFLRKGAPADEPVSYTLLGLGRYLSRQLSPGKTAWGPFRFVRLEQPEPKRLLFRFRGSGELEGKSLLFSLWPRKWDFEKRDGEGYGSFRGDQLQLEVVDDERPEEGRDAPEMQPERLIGFALARALAQDPEIFFPADGPPSDVGDGDEGASANGDVGYLARHYARVRHEAFSRGWKADYRWHRFLYPPSRCIVNLFRLGSDEAFVAHESLECILNEPPWSPPDSTIFANRRTWQVGEFWQSCRMVVTDLKDADVVSGRSMKRLDEALEVAAEASPNRSVVVKSGCLPNVIGDNPAPAMKRLEKKTGTKFYWIASTIDYWSYTANLIRDRLLKVAPPDAPRDPLGVAIVGGATPSENSELLGLLETVGMHPLGVVLPSVDYPNFEAVREASIFAWANQTSLRNIGELMFDGLPVTLIRPPSPAGLAGTLQWLGRIVEQTGEEGPVMEAYEAMCAAPGWQERLDLLKRRTDDYALAFVSDPEELEVFTDTTLLYGYSILDLVLEMGFSAHIVVKGEPRTYVTTQEAMAARGLGERVSFYSFSDAAELRARLRDPRVGAVFSDFTADPRATGAGRNTFSEVDFELGIEGFFRTAEHLLRICMLRPLAGYEAYIGSTGAPP